MEKRIIVYPHLKRSRVLVRTPQYNISVIHNAGIERERGVCIYIYIHIQHIHLIGGVGGFSLRVKQFKKVPIERDPRVSLLEPDT